MIETTQQVGTGTTDKLLARFVYLPLSTTLPPFLRAVNPEAGNFSATAVRDIFGRIYELFDVAADISAEAVGEARRSRDADALQVQRITLASPLEIILSLGGPFAVVTTLRHSIELISELFNIRARIHRDRAQLEAERLAHEVEAVRSETQLVLEKAALLRAKQRPGELHPTTVDFWIGHADDAPPALQPGRTS